MASLPFKCLDERVNKFYSEWIIIGTFSHRHCERAVYWSTWNENNSYDRYFFNFPSQRSDLLVMRSTRYLLKFNNFVQEEVRNEICVLQLRHFYLYFIKSSVSNFRRFSSKNWILQTFIDVWKKPELSIL